METRWTPLVAAAAIVAIAGTLMWKTSGRSDAPAGTPTLIAARTLTTPVGGRDSVVLPDGSQVVVGPGSELTIGAGYGQSDRRIALRGEALFTVTHDANRPFIVTANGTEIRDVGTAFVVHSDAGGVRVAVTEGVVEVNRAAKPTAATTLNAGDVATVSPAGAVTTARGVGADADLAWTRGQLVFRDAPLSEVGEDLRRWYGVHLDIRDAALRARPLTATFQRGDSLSSVLRTISYALGAQIERRGDTAVVRPLPR